MRFGNNMSRVGKKPITIPEKTEVVFDGSKMTVKGPLGEISRDFRDDVEIKVGDGSVTLTPRRNSKAIVALWGTYASHVRNMIDGVTKGFEKKLVVEGVGFKVQLEGNKIVLGLGFSHPVNVDIPEGLNVEVEKNTISIKGVDKEKVGSFSAIVRDLKKPEPYKGKGIRYDDEVVRRKEGKKAATAV